MVPHAPKKSLGQNFLIDRRYQQKIVAALEASAGSEVLEIGPGKGALTRGLVESGVRLTAVELDDGLAAVLEQDPELNMTVVRGDALRIPLPPLFEDWSETRVVGNIPYNITSPLIFRLLEPPRPRVIVLMVQAEVADRIVSPPGKKSYGALSVGVRSVADVSRLFGVPRTVFRPVPGVDSAVIRLLPRRPSTATDEQLSELRTLTRAAFGWRRKQLGTILRKHPDFSLPQDAVQDLLEGLDHPVEVRPERLSPAEFVDLARALALLR